MTHHRRNGGESCVPVCQGASTDEPSLAHRKLPALDDDFSDSSAFLRSSGRPDSKLQSTDAEPSQHIPTIHRCTKDANGLYRTCKANGPVTSISTVRLRFRSPLYPVTILSHPLQ